ncbi:hypothetical protein [Botrimarina sp.]|uniref:hypothetical protein n=1 Tax=Botrimarina sp. TaxID=2795802 RepID=UPI0032ED1199
MTTLPAIDRPTRRGLGLLAALVGVASAAAGAPVLPPPVVSPRLDFTIPYRWTGPTTGTQEVVLFYSADEGRSWRRAGSAAPHVRAFAFRAPADGEYWFAIRSYDGAGRATPPAPLGPEMRVVADTESPRVERFDATLVGGRLRVDLAATDARSFGESPATIYARADGQPAWAPLEVRSAATGGGTALEVTAEWTPPAGTSRVEVRAAVADAAGNRAEQTATAGPSTSGPAPQSVATGSPLDRAWSALAGAAPGGPPPQPAAASSDPFVVAERNRPAALPAAPPGGAAAPDALRRGEGRSTAWPAEVAKLTPLGGADGPPAGRGASAFRSAGFRVSDPFARSDSGAPALSVGGLADAPPARLVNSAEFEFEYELEDSGRWGVANVELWGTDDGGRSWRRFAIDSDRQSPIHVVTPGEGTYGFRLVVESVGGLGAAPPQPGDAPEAVVRVDLHAPRVAIRSVQQGDGYFADQLSIDWTADDEHLADHPIALSYSNRPTGPWIPIATGLANSGRHDWRLQRHLPKRLYVKLEAADAAGNTASAITSEAIEIDVPTASGSLRGVRSR